jgi:tetratricopeptide (TPR) repeat protein
MGRLFVSLRPLWIGFAILLPIAVASCASMNIDRPRPACAAPKSADDHYRCGMQHYHDGNYPAAIRAFTRAFELDPDYDDAIAMRGLCKRHDGDLQGALADFDAAIRLRPNDSSHYNNRGNANWDAGDENAAIYDFSRAIEIEPTAADAFYNRGVLYFDRNELYQAISDFGTAIEFYGDGAAGNLGRLRGWYDPEFYHHPIRPTGLRRIDQYLADAYFYRGVINRRLGEEERAREDFAAARKIDPSIDDRLAHLLD